MDFNLQTPALIFPAISLLMLAYTNRFLTLAGLVRDLVSRHEDDSDKNILHQIKNLQIRMNYIRKMQIWGALAFTLAVLSMLLLMFKNIPQVAAVIAFVTSLLFLLISLLYLVKELHISINALTIQLDSIKKEKEH